MAKGKLTRNVTKLKSRQQAALDSMVARAGRKGNGGKKGKGSKRRCVGKGRKAKRIVRPKGKGGW